MQPSPQDPPRRRATRRALAAIAVVAIAVIASFFVRESLEVEWTAESVRAAVEQAGFWGPVIFLMMMTFRFVVLIPSPILLSAAGICFGVAAGTLYGGLGLLLSALLKFAVAKLLGRELLIAHLPQSARQRLKLANSRLGIGALGAASGYPIGPAGIIHVGAILSGMRIVPFTLAVGVGSVLRAALFSYFGNAFTQGEGLVLATLLLIGVAVVPLAVPPWRAWIVDQVSAARTSQ
ncbi:MAG: TVP38/TMEM64 family protein [Myxococcota bacterium]